VTGDLCASLVKRHSTDLTSRPMGVVLPWIPFLGSRSPLSRFQSKKQSTSQSKMQQKTMSAVHHWLDSRHAHVSFRYTIRDGNRGNQSGNRSQTYRDSINDEFASIDVVSPAHMGKPCHSYFSSWLQLFQRHPSLS